MSSSTDYPPSGIYADSYEKDSRIIKTPGQLYFLLGGLALLLVVPYLPLFGGTYALRLIIGIAITSIICLGLNILTGFCGQLNIGQSAFVMVGAFTSGLLNLHWGWSFWAAVLPSGIAAAMVGVLFGIPSVRLKGLYLALTTLGAQIILTWAALFGLPITAAGFEVDSVSIGSFIFDTPSSFYYIAIAFLILMVLIAKNILRTKTGRAFVAIRDNEKAAAGMGINIFAYKLLAFAICTFYAGIGGSLFVYYMKWAQLESFSMNESVWYIVMIIIGGAGSISGAIMGVTFITILKEFIFILGPFAEEQLSFLPIGAGSGLLLVFIGGIAIFFLQFEPRGIAHRWNLLKDYYRLWPFSH